jgi:hypothetical protein
MFIADLIAALVVGIVIVFLISMAFGTKGPWGSLLWFFMVVALFAWVGGVWFRPYGPVWYGVGWLPIIFVGFLVAMLLTAASPRNPRKRLATKEEAIREEERSTAVDAFFWILIVLLVLAATSHYYWYPQIR